MLIGRSFGFDLAGEARLLLSAAGLDSHHLSLYSASSFIEMLFLFLLLKPYLCLVTLSLVHLGPILRVFCVALL